MLVEIAVVHQGILCRESQVFGEIIIRASFVECFCRIPFCIVSIQVVSSLYIHFILNHWYNPQSVETVSFIADSRQVAIRCATVISVSHGFGKGISRRMNVFRTESESVRSIFSTNGISMLRQASYMHSLLISIVVFIYLYSFSISSNEMHLIPIFFMSKTLAAATSGVFAEHALVQITVS